jgi:hypothetical protein
MVLALAGIAGAGGDDDAICGTVADRSGVRRSTMPPAGERAAQR